MSKKILTMLSEYGFWGEELIGPLEMFDAAGYEVNFATPTGRRPVALPPSMDPDYIDPPLGRSVTSSEMAEKVRAIDKSPRLDNPLNITELMPERPYFSSHNLIRELEAYNKAVDAAGRGWLAAYDALLIVGGSGPIVDLANNQRVHDIILTFLSNGKPIGAECYGVACLAFARDGENRKSMIWGKHVTAIARSMTTKTARDLWGLTSIWGRHPILWSTFCAMRLAPMAHTSAISAGKHRSSLTIRSLRAAPLRIRISPDKRW
jgi:putative intracellular protease/amidase